MMRLIAFANDGEDIGRQRAPEEPHNTQKEKDGIQGNNLSFYDIQLFKHLTQ